MVFCLLPKIKQLEYIIYPVTSAGVLIIGIYTWYDPVVYINPVTTLLPMSYDVIFMLPLSSRISSILSRTP